MRDVDDWIRALQGPPAPVAVPRSRPVWGWMALAAAVVLAFALWPASAALRGAADPPSLDLRLAVERGNVAVRATDGSVARVGESVFFRLSASAETEAAVWVEGPGGREPIGTASVGPSPLDLADDRGLVAYRFEAPGRYVFRASRAAFECAGCPSVALEVQ